MADARLRVVVIWASERDIAKAKVLANFLRRKGNEVWELTLERDSISDLSADLGRRPEKVSHLIAFLNESKLHDPQWLHDPRWRESIEQLPQSPTIVLIRVSPTGKPVPFRLENIKNGITVSVRSNEEIDTAILNACPELDPNAQDSEGWYKHIESTYKTVSDYDRHYSSVRSAVTTFLLTFSYYMAALFFKDAQTPEALIFSHALPILFLTLACILSSHFQTLTAACANIEKQLDQKLKVVTNPGFVGQTHLAFRTLLENEHKKTYSFYPDVSNIALWIVTAAYGFGAWLVTQRFVCPENFLRHGCINRSLQDSTTTSVASAVISVVPDLPLCFGVIVFIGGGFQFVMHKTELGRKIRTAVRISIEEGL